MKKNSTILGVQLNNPLNIRHNPANRWQGAIGKGGGFVHFKGNSWGIRAAYIILCRYIKNGYDTIEEIISRWAPPTENDTEKYISFVCDEMIAEPSDKMSVSTIHGYWTLIMLIQAMAKMETGQHFDEQTINLYINYPEKFE